MRSRALSTLLYFLPLRDGLEEIIAIGTQFGLAHARDWPPRPRATQDVTAVAVCSRAVAVRLAPFSFRLELPRGIRAMQGMR